ncbi:hypothetical protein V8G54_011505 [Vigna mungo]|uniref:AAR2 N-terminal domain-containing protein n=1 Tax=Vigna mungo TaxID=3915 RepID=A0AAQ3S345_VIGMU
MDSEKALELVKQGVTLLFLDVPQYTMVAIDTQTFYVGPAFKGIKMIPPSTHFVYYSSSSRDGKEFSPIVGFFIDTGASEGLSLGSHSDASMVNQTHLERLNHVVRSSRRSLVLGVPSMPQGAERTNLFHKSPRVQDSPLPDSHFKVRTTEENDVSVENALEENHNIAAA